MNEYIALIERKAKKAEKLDYIANHPFVLWSKMEANKDQTYSKAKINAYLRELQSEFQFPEDSFESKVIQVSNLIAEEKSVKAEVKKKGEELHQKTKDTIESLSDEQVLVLLNKKWVSPIVEGINALPDAILNKLVSEISDLTEKYAVTYSKIVEELVTVEKSLHGLIDELDGSEFDMRGLSEFQSLLMGE